MSYTKYVIWVIARRHPDLGLEVVYNTMGNTAQEAWNTLALPMAEGLQKQGFRATKTQITSVIRTVTRAEIKADRQTNCDHVWRLRKRTMGKNSGYTHICTKCLKVGSEATIAAMAKEKENVTVTDGA